LRFFYTVTLKRPWAVEDDIPTSRKLDFGGFGWTREIR
jgi:hypothetical protein